MSAVEQLTRCTVPNTLCGRAGTPHRHCVCGLPISLDQHWCSLCWLELFRPRRRQAQRGSRRRGLVVYWQ